MTRQEIRERYTELRKSGRKFVPCLVVDNQHFHAHPDALPKKEAEWYRDQLATALERLISQNQP